MNTVAKQLKPKASVIVAVYKDTEALACILSALKHQSEQDFEIVVTEDGQDKAMEAFITEQKKHTPNLYHLTQEDSGFQKTKAANRAILDARADYLIFIDGDCIPRYDFVSAHLKHAKKGKVSTARRVYLGPRASWLIRRNKGLIRIIENRLIFLLLMIPLHLDRVRSYEVGLPSRILHRLTRHRLVSIVGCNLSCFKKDMLKINGYNENLTGVGGEDNDLHWRFEGLGINIKSIKFQAAVYHLYHKAGRHGADLNIKIMNENKKKNAFVCANGIYKKTTAG